LVIALVHVDAKKLLETFPKLDITHPGDWK